MIYGLHIWAQGTLLQVIKVSPREPREKPRKDAWHLLWRSGHPAGLQGAMEASEWMYRRLGKLMGKDRDDLDSCYENPASSIFHVITVKVNSNDPQYQ